MAGPMLMKHPNPNQTGPLYQSEKVAFFFSNTLSYFFFLFFLHSNHHSFETSFFFFFLHFGFVNRIPAIFVCLSLSLSLSLSQPLFFFFFLLYSLHDLNLSFAVDILSLVTILLVSSLFVYKKTAHL
jgi:hypothetical protein